MKSLEATLPAEGPRRLGKNLWKIGIGLGLGCALLPWQQTAIGTGRVAAYSPTDRRQSIDAPVDGRLGKWFVQEGTVLKEGDPVVELSDNDPEIMTRLSSERDALERRLRAARLSARTAEKNVARQKELLNEGISSRRAFEMAEIEHARFLADEASASAELSRLEVRFARQNVQLVRAPRSGTILKRKAGEESQLVKMGDSLAEIVPITDSRAVELWLKGNDVPLVRVGSNVRIQFEGWPAIQFSGWPSVAVGTFAGVVSFIDPADNGHGNFRAVVVPAAGETWPGPEYLRQGGRAKGWVLLGRVTVAFEIWRQFNGFPPSLADPKSQEGL